ncbi:MAG: tRNA pseudouridine(55) synthase TruB [Gammaproteobacteria bacterium]
MSQRRRVGRDVCGILLLDKPAGIGSNEALQAVKRLFQARKAGHTGSLDRLATGLLPLCFGEATKISGFLLGANKRYRAMFRLGQKTTTGDAEGDVIGRRPVPDFSDQELKVAVQSFRGPIEQVPPMHSALKLQGQRLYKLAHQGLNVYRKARPVTIHDLRILRREPERLEVEVHCSKGTYVRTLAEDIGEALGCGAHVESLRRIGSGPFDDSSLVTLSQLQAVALESLAALDSLLCPMEAAIADWPDVNLPEEVAYYVRRGQAVLVPHAPTQGWVKIYGQRKGFLGLGEVLEDGRIAPRRLLGARL